MTTDIRNVHDAMVIFEAVRQGILPLVERRLSAAERDALHSGHVFVWEEGEHKQGLERWTDGRR
jgi:Gti1/Pac2 family transcription factor